MPSKKSPLDRGGVLLLIVMLGATGPVPAAITLPEPLAIEIPVDGQVTIDADTSPLRDLLESATSTLGSVTHDKAGVVFPLGPTLVTWDDGTDTKAAWVYVYPFGQSPVGSSGYERATAGNGATHVVRDRLGKIHVAWLDSGRGLDRVMYRRGSQAPDSGAITWEIAPLRLSEPANDVYNSMVGMAVSENYVHFVWYGGGNASYYRRLRLADYGLDPVRNTTAAGSLADNGPSIAVRDDDEIHVVTPASGGTGGQHALSVNGGQTWTVEPIPRPTVGIQMKAVAVAVDRHGNAHIVFPWIVRNSRFGFWSETQPNRGFWQLRYVRRTVGGAWEDEQYALAQFPAWQDPLADADTANDDWDVLSDWLDIAVDEHDHIHVAWHGTIHTHIFANDEAFYIRRPATGPGAWSVTWDPYVSLWPVASGFSFAPSICVDAPERLALPVVFYDTSANYEFDSNFVRMRSGTWDGAPPVPLTTMAADGYGLSTWFPGAAPSLYTHPNGRVWLDVVATDWPAEPASDLIIVHQRRELTSMLRESQTLSVDRDRLSWEPLIGAAGYDIVRGDLQILRASGGDFTTATQECLVEDHPLLFLDLVGTPQLGQGYWFLVRGVDAFGGFTYESSGPGQLGARDDEIGLAANACL